MKIDRWLALLRPPRLPDQADEQRARVLYPVLVMSGGITLALAAAVCHPSIPLDGRYAAWTSHALLLAVLLPCMWLVRRGSVRTAGVIFSAAIWMLVTGVLIGFGGIDSPTVSIYVVVAVLAGYFWGARGVVGFSVASLVAASLVGWAESLGWTPEPLAPVTLEYAWLVLFAALAVTSALMTLSLRSMDEVLTRLRTRVDQQESISELARVALADPTVDSLERMLAGQVASVLDVTHVAFWELSPDRQALLCRAVVGRDAPPASELRLSVSESSHSIEALKGSDAVVVEDFATDERFATSRALLSLGTRSGAALRIAGSGGPIGVIGVYSPRPRRFTAADLQFLESAAALLGLAAERGRTDQVLRESEERYRSLWEQSPDGLFLHVDGEVVFANPAFARLVGASGADALVGRKVIDLVQVGGSEEMRSRTLELLQEGQVARAGTDRWRLESGDAIPVEVTSRALRYEGRPAVQVLVRDVSERAKLEEELLQAQKMEAVGRFAGGIAHDFNNILTVISACSDSALSEPHDRHSREEDLQEIRRATHRAAGLTRQILSLSRHKVVEPALVDVGEVVRGTETMLRRVIGEDIELVTELEPELGSVWADPGQLEQVILNLAVNARDAMPEGGRLTIRASSVELGVFQLPAGSDLNPGRYVQLEMIDTGMGMDEGVQSRVFDPFFTTKDPSMGTGLGLSTVFSIVNQSRGWIGVRSQPGRGSAFRVHLPSRDRAPGPDTRRAALHDSRGSETVLLAEDDAGVRRIARRVLEQAGYHVLEASNGVEALDVASAHDGEIQLLVSDVIMPEMNGAELCDQIVKLRPGIRVLFVSGYADDVLESRPHLGGDFLAKPFAPADLTEKARSILDAQP